MEQGLSSSDAWRVFDAWSLVRQSLSQRTLSDASVLAYRSIWSGWCDYLVDHQLLWSTARAQDVRGFLSGLSGSGRGRSEATSVTQSRYARILEQVYAVAVANGWVATNPVVREALVSTSEVHESLVLNRVDWRELLQHWQRRAPPELDLLGGTGRWQAMRDHAALGCMIYAGLTVGEVRALTLDKVAHPRLVWTGHPPVPLVALPLLPGMAVPVAGQDSLAPPALSLTLQGNRDAQSRTLSIAGPLEVAMLAWLDVRSTRPLPTGRHSPVFVSQKGGGATPVSSKSLFVLANDLITGALAARYPQGLAHAGPTTLRNSCIVRWLDDDMPETAVLRLAGFKDAQSLRRLRQHQHRHAALGTTAAGEDYDCHHAPR